MSKVLFQEHKPSDEAGLTARPGQAEAPAPGDQADAPAQTLAITEAAAREIERQRTKRGTPNAAIRVGLRGGGCTGFSYVFDWDDKPARDKDHVFEEHGVTVRVDHRSFKLLAGTTLDFETSIMGYGFKFVNPNAKGTCGCGESVQF
jgi:iron-sulfur cluster assembly protein